VIWGSWVEMNPRTASELGIADCDVVDVSSAHGSVRLPVILYPAIRPEVIALPTGQGHSAYGRNAQSRGVNPASLSPLAANLMSSFARGVDDDLKKALFSLFSSEGAEHQALVRVKVTKTNDRSAPVRFGTGLWEALEDRR